MEQEEVEQVPAVPTYTLEEHLARQQQSSLLQSEVNLRKVEASFSGMKVVARNDDETFIALGKAKAAAKKDAQQRSTNKSVIVDLGFQAPEPVVADEDRRGGRGGGRGGADRGKGGRGGRGNNQSPRSSNKSKVDISDVSAFPSLS